MELRVPYLLAGTPNSLHSVPARPYAGGDDLPLTGLFWGGVEGGAQGASP